jgi:hypothetical protein
MPDMVCRCPRNIPEVHEDEFRRMLEPGRKKMDKLIGRCIFDLGQALAIELVSTRMIKNDQ